LPIGMPNRREPGSALPRNFAGNFMADLPKNFLEFSQQLNEHSVKTWLLAVMQSFTTARKANNRTRREAPVRFETNFEVKGYLLK